MRVAGRRPQLARTRRGSSRRRSASAPWPTGGTPPMAKPVRLRTKSASALPTGSPTSAGEARDVDALRARGHDEQRARSLACGAEHQRVGDLADLAAEIVGRGLRGARGARQLDDSCRRAPRATSASRTRSTLGIGGRRSDMRGERDDYTIGAWSFSPGSGTSWCTSTCTSPRSSPQYGVWVYALLFAIVFCETGLVVTPFLPGDSLLFVVGAVAAVGDMDIVAGDGDAGRRRAVRRQRQLLGRALDRAAACSTSRSRAGSTRRTCSARTPFYERHGGKTIIIARFVPIVRTYVPFVAGLGAMPYARYIDLLRRRRAALGGVAVPAGLLLRQHARSVKSNLTLVILAHRRCSRSRRA